MKSQLMYYPPYYKIWEVDTMTDTQLVNAYAALQVERDAEYKNSQKKS
jgi:hypothetical protein